jgi:excisionase family DNA binding protein
MDEHENKIMTAQEVAQYLRLDVTTIYRLAQAGGIPAVKVGRAWRFKKELIEEWFRLECLGLVEPEKNAGVCS